MNRTVQCYAFEASVPAREIEDTLLLAVLAVEGLHGASRVQLEASYCFDADKHACVINVGSDVGRDICRIFGGFALRQFGEGTFTVTRADGAPDSTMEKIPGMTPRTAFKRSPWSTDILIREAADVYHAQADRYLSSHQLAEFRRNPPLFHKKKLGLVKDEDRPAYLIGRAAHTLILEGREAYEREYAVGGPVNPKTGEPFGSRTKAFQEWAEAQAKPVLTDDQAALVESLNAAVRAHEHAAGLLADGIPEGVIRVEYCGVPCQSRLDWLNPERGIVDLKTCDNLDWLQTDARNYGYAHQMAFYRAVLACVIGTNLPVYLIAVEKREPFRCGVWRMGEDVLGIAQTENEEGIQRLKACLERDHWPSGYEDVRVFDWI